MKLFFENQSRSNQALILNALFLAVLVLNGMADSMAIVFAYVFETLIIGFFQVIKLFSIIKHNQDDKSKSIGSQFVIIPFFMIHFGFFILIQTLFIYMAFAIQDDRLSTSLSSKMLTTILEFSGFKIVMTFIFITHLIDYLADFLKNKKYLHQEIGLYFIKPYTRIFIQQFLAIIPFFFLLFEAKVGVVAALLLIALRTLLDFYLNRMERNKKSSKVFDPNFVDDKPMQIKEMERSVNRFL